MTTPKSAKTLKKQIKALLGILKDVEEKVNNLETIELGLSKEHSILYNQLIKILADTEHICSSSSEQITKAKKELGDLYKKVPKK